MTVEYCEGLVPVEDGEGVVGVEGWGCCCHLLPISFETGSFLFTAAGGREWWVCCVCV